MISHRLSTLGNVDEIVVLQKGRIVERGTYTMLKKMGGVFAGLLEEQSRYSAERLARRGRIVVAAPSPARAVVDAAGPLAPAPPSPPRQLGAILDDLRATVDEAFAQGNRRGEHANGNGHINGHGNGHGGGVTTLEGRVPGAWRSRRGVDRMAAEVAAALDSADADDPPASVLRRLRDR